MSISASQVKDLREHTGAGMMDCKKALEETGGDMEKAVDWLRQKGLSKAAKKAGRATSEGTVACEIFADGKKAALVAVCCETDFVSRGEKFVAFVEKTMKHFTTSGKTELAEDDIREHITDAIATLGENITIGKSCMLEHGGHGVFGHYVHNNGKIAVIAEIHCGKAESQKKPELAELAKNIAMQIAAANPLAVSADCLDPALVEREREVYRQKALEEGKPENIVDKIADGAVKKYCKEVCLLDQPYIRDDKTTINDLVAKTGKELGDTLSVRRFARVQLGE